MALAQNGNSSPSTYDINRTFNSVTLNTIIAGATAYTISNAGGFLLGIQSGGFITDNNTKGADTVNTGVTLNGPAGATFTLSAGATGLSFGTNAITGTGPLTLTNNSTDDALALNVANTYTGATTVSGTGRVKASVNGAIPTGSALTVNGSLLFGASSTIGSLAGGGTVALGSTTLTAGGDNTSTTFSGVLSGTGGLTKAGTGTLTLSGANTYTGTTTISAGTLQVGAGGTSGSIAGNITNNGTLVFSRSDSVTYAGIISGAGGLTKAGTGTLTVSGTNTYSGGTTVSAGTLAGTTTSLQGAITNNAAVTFDQTTSGTYAGAMSGTGTLTKAGTGTVTLSGANTYTGGTTVSAGTLRAGAANVFGTGAMTVSSGAMLDLGGFSQTLASMTIGAGSTLGGTGTVNSAVTILSGGVLAPGNSIGTITVSGSLTFNAGSIYRVEVDAAGNADRTNVTGAPGTATIGGGTVDVQASAGTYQANTQYTILNATGGVTGTFSTVTSNLAFLTPSLSYNPNNVFLALARNDVSFAGVAATANQRAVATVLQNSSAGATGDLSTVLTAVTGLSAPQARSAFDAIGGATHVALRRAGTAFAGGFGQQLNRRLGLVARDDAAGRMAGFASPIQLAANDWLSDARPIYAQAGGASASGSTASRDGRGFWMRAYGATQDTEADGNAAGDKLRGGGLSFGADTEVREGLVLGIAATGGTSRVSFSGLSDSGRSRGTAVGLYGSYVQGPWTFKGIAGLAWNDNHADRNVVAGALVRTATSDFDSKSQSLYAEATYDLKMPGYTLQPLAALSTVRTKADGFTESGAGALNLQVSGQTTRSTRSLLGAKTIHEVGRVKLEPRLLWAHEFGNVNAPMTASLSGAPAAGSFQVAGVALKRDSLVLGLGASGAIAKNVTLFADLQIEHNSRQKSYAAFVGVRGVW